MLYFYNMDAKIKSKGKKLNIERRQKGIICIIIAALGFAFMNLFIKLSGDLPVMEKAFFRNLIAAFVALFIMLKNKINLAEKVQI